MLCKYIGGRNTKTWGVQVIDANKEFLGKDNCEAGKEFWESHLRGSIFRARSDFPRTIQSTESSSFLPLIDSIQILLENLYFREHAASSNISPKLIDSRLHQIFSISLPHTNIFSLRLRKIKSMESFSFIILHAFQSASFTCGNSFSARWNLKPTMFINL